ncbi:MAG: HEAT repeat domain-containing protein [Phycisphaerales bacterium]|nr:MAG: HEAT repeat domain-containing protein [Phycisphaerales bacterium]
MIRTVHMISLCLLVCAIAAARAGAVEDRAYELQCYRSAVSAARDEADVPAPQYAPDREADILHITIDVTPDFKTRTVAGTTSIKFAPIVKPLAELRLDAIDLDVSSVTSSANIEGFNVTDEVITITFEPAIRPGDQTTVTVIYEAEPKQGLYFRTPEMGYPEQDTHLFTQGESHLAPHWYPNYDYPNERSSSEVICRVPKEMTVLSNGRLVSEEVDSETGLKAVTWLQEKPHVNYLIALVAGKLKKIESKYKDIPIAFYTPASLIEYAQNSFKDTADMLEFYEEEIGVPYPWDQYYQAVVQDFVAGGMENTTLTILTERTLHTDETQNIRSSQGLVAHELVHQWFGDYVTCKDWSHTWLNEGFATYYEDLYDGYKNGSDSMLAGLYGTASYLLADRPEHKPIVYRSYRRAGEQFDYRTYSKAGWVLHMLRTELGERMFRKCVKKYLERHALGSVVTEDFRSVIEELTGRSYDRFFDEWIYHGRHPDLKVSYNWSEKDKLAKISIEQTHQVSDKVMLFGFRTKVRFMIGDEIIDRPITIDATQHDFYFLLPGEPKIVRFDPDYGLLANIDFEKPTAMLYEQLEDANDVIGRLRAVDALKKEKDQKTVAKLKDVLNNDPFHAVRERASEALREIRTDEAFEAIAESLDQADARVRLQVVRDIGRFYRPQSLDVIRRTLRNEKNPAILEVAIRNLGLYHHRDTRRLILDYLESRSFRNELASAAVEAIRMSDEPFFIAPLQQTLDQRRMQLPSRSFARGLDTLAHIARNEDEKAKVRDFLAGCVHHPMNRIQAGAIRALGTLGDPRAIPIVETFSSDEPDDAVERAATTALRQLRQRKELVPDEIVRLRETVEKLRKQTEKLADDLDDINKRLDAKEEAGVKKDATEALDSSQGTAQNRNAED